MFPKPYKTITSCQIHEVMTKTYERFRTDTQGKNADYIPYLANVDPSLFGISVCLLDGTVLSVGDHNFRFGIESVSKVHTAVLAMQHSGPDTVMRRIGANATGLPFDSIMAILLEKERPSTPLVNAGAIAACSLVKPIGDAEGKWQAIRQNIAALSGEEDGSAIPLIEELYASESATNFNNRSIAWLLKDFGRIYDDPEVSLDLYTRQCSLGITSDQLAIAAATIANDGKNPKTGVQVFDAELAPKVTSLVTTVGFYERTGDWLYDAGIPAKSGVGGGVMGIMPGLFGICAFAPPLDPSGNSVKAQMAIKAIMKELDVNVFASSHLTMVDC